MSSAPDDNGISSSTAEIRDAAGQPGAQRPLSPYAVGWERICAALRNAAAPVEPGQEVGMGR